MLRHLWVTSPQSLDICIVFYVLSNVIGTPNTVEYVHLLPVDWSLFWHKAICKHNVDLCPLSSRHPAPEALLTGSLWPSDAIGRHEFGSSLDRVMHSCPKPILTFVDWTQNEQISVKLIKIKIKSKCNYCHSRKCLWKCLLHIWSHFWSGLMVLNVLFQLSQDTPEVTVTWPGKWVTVQDPTCGYDIFNPAQTRWKGNAPRRDSIQTNKIYRLISQELYMALCINHDRL